jgi:molecular chaperone GrpE
MTEELSQKGSDRTENQTAETPQQQEAEKPTGVEVQLGELQQKLEAAESLANSYKDQLLRKAAEFENYKKRSEAEYLTVVRMATERLITSLLPVLDDFTRSLKSGEEVKEHKSFYKGVSLIYNKFTRLLESHGLTSFDSAGKPFDVEYHDALLQTPRSDIPPHTVVEEVEKGYKLFDKVIRHAKVIVSTEPDVTVPSDASGENAKAGPSGGSRAPTGQGDKEQQ